LVVSKRRLGALTGAAIDTLEILLRTGTEKTKLDAAKALLDRAGLLPIAEKAASGAITLSEMPISDLRAMADTLEAELANRAKPVSLSAGMAGNGAETIDLSEDILA
jgi:hypothetical protein